jgi:two-component system nitrogen regulation response regulator NtrX
MMEKQSNKPLVLIVDDERGIRDTLAGIFEDEGWEARTTGSGAEGIKLYQKQVPNLVLLDVWMPGIDGISVLQELKRIDAGVPVVIMSGHGTIETAVKATKLGAFDYLEKPLSLDKVLPLLQHASDIREKTSSKLKDDSLPRLIGESASMQEIKRLISVVAPRNSWVLITGENGTGKEVVARHIHHHSSRANRTFVAVNCAAIPEELIESELFGHTKGAFTNAISAKKGKFELADQGTLFLDEIADMSLKTQAKVLRILQEQKFEKVGGLDTLEVDVRVVAATNKDLQKEISEGRFREDLYYRLNVIPFRLPPLKEREDDIEHLSDYFLDQMASELGEAKKKIDGGALSVLKSYNWPGNIRELKNLLERLCITVPGEQIYPSDLSGLFPEDLVQPSDLSGHISNASTLKEAKTDFERAFILGKLEENDWNVTRTAESIGIERSNLHRKMKLYGLDPKQRGD